MSEDSNLKALADLVQADHAEQRALDRLCEGSLPAAEHAALRERALHDPQLRAALEAYTPLPAQHIRGLFVQNAARTVQPLRASAGRTRRWIAAAAFACAAAGVLWVGARPCELPEYTLSARGAAEIRSANVPRNLPLVIAPNTQLQLWLQPSHSVDYAIAARVFLRAEGRCDSLPAASERSEQGAVRIELQPFDQTLPASAALIVVVGRTGEIAALRAERACSEAGAGSRWRSWTLPLRAAP